MGRIFETRKSTMFARWDRMSKAFHRIGKEIAIAVKAAGPTPENNPALRRAIQNARAVAFAYVVEVAAHRPSGRYTTASRGALTPGRWRSPARLAPRPGRCR